MVHINSIFPTYFGGVGYGSFIYNKAKAVVNDAYAKLISHQSVIKKLNL